MSIQALLLKIDKFSKNEKEFLFTFLKNTNVQYSKNKNGYFFRLNSANKELISTLTQYIHNIETHRNSILESELERERKLEYYKNIELKQKKDEYDSFKSQYEERIIIVNYCDFNIVKCLPNKKVKLLNFNKKKYSDVYKHIFQNMNRIKKEFNKFHNSKDKNTIEGHVEMDGEDIIGGGDGDCEGGEDFDVGEEGEDFEEGLEEGEGEEDLEEDADGEHSDNSEVAEKDDDGEVDVEDDEDVERETEVDTTPRNSDALKLYLQYKNILLKYGYTFKEQIIFQKEELLV